MLFINFLCLLYLMVLTDSHTISKSIGTDNKLHDNIIDSIHEVDRPTVPKSRKDRHHKYKSYNKNDDLALPDGLKATKSYAEFEKGTEKITHNKSNGKTTPDHVKRQKSPKRRVGGFWKKLRGKDKKKENKHGSNDRKRRISLHKKETLRKNDHLTTKDSRNTSPRPKGRRKNRKKFSPRQHEHKVKRDASSLFSTRPYSNTPQSYKLQMGIAPQIENMLKNKFKINALPPYPTAIKAPSIQTSGLQGDIETITSRLSGLKLKYGVDKNNDLNIKSSSNDNIQPKKHSDTNPEVISTTELEFQGTAQIEEMVNNMKIKAMHMISEQTPVEADLIGGLVTEATYDSSPVLNLVGAPHPDHSLSTDRSSNIKPNAKITIASTELDDFNMGDFIVSSNTESHYIAARSIKEDTMTIAQNVEDLLQRELKNIYNKVKKKVSCDFRKEVHTVKSTAKEGYSKLSSKLANKTKPKLTSPMPASSTRPPKLKTSLHKTVTPSKQGNVTTASTSPRVKKKDDKEDKFMDETYTDAVYSTKQTYDDYMMLTLYEQMLTKAQKDDNVRKILANTDYPLFARNKRDAFRLSKRNPETLTDVKLKEVVQNLYDDGNNMPDYDYIDPAANVTSTGHTTATNNNYNIIDYVVDSPGTPGNEQGPIMGTLEFIDQSPRTTAPGPAEDDVSSAYSNSALLDSSTQFPETSFEGLSDKICYNEFVNGYKHYLKFQREQSNQNFSNLVKYQAHRHHSVDDIGKYILKKIPPLPNYNKRKREQIFFDDSDSNMDYQEITTRSDDSWFKKHFYLFFDNEPPKKYHTSETVELKHHLTESKIFMTEPTSKVGHEDEHIFIQIGSDSLARKTKENKEICLEDLSNILKTMKETHTNSQLKDKTKTQKDGGAAPYDNYNITNDANNQEKSFIGKLFSGKCRQAPKTGSATIDIPEHYYAFTESTLGRLKRSITKVDLANTILSDFMTKNAGEKVSTAAKDVFGDAAPIGNKETNKYGYVDIDVVPRQTAVVKLRENAKKSRFKNFFKKFHLRKKKKKEIKPKRACDYYPENRRKERFNPIKKLKSIFKMKEEPKEKDDPAQFSLPDYESLDSRINEFKPKFEKPLSVDEMQKQVPNISDSYFEPVSKKASTKASTNYFNLDDKDKDLLYNYNISSHTDESLLSHTKSSKLAKTEKSTTSQTETTSTDIMATGPMESTNIKKSHIHRIPPTNVMTVNVKMMGLTTTTKKTSTSTPSMTIDDMSVVIDNMQHNILKEITNHTKGRTASYSPSSVRQNKYEQKKNVHEQINNVPEQLIYKSKLTRIAKIPMSKRRFKTNKYDGYTDNIGKVYLSFDGPPAVNKHDLRSRNADKKKSAKGKNMRKLQRLQSSKLNKDEDKDKSKYTDYFNDLIMWHNDILNLDTVPNPEWEKILKTLQADANNYRTPNMNNLLIELGEMNDYLNPSDGSNKSAISVARNGSLTQGFEDRVSARGLNKPIQGLIRRVAMDDNAVITSKDLLIRGEAKYYQCNKPISSDKLLSGDFIMKLNSLKAGDDDKAKRKINGKSKLPRKKKGNSKSSLSATGKHSESVVIVDDDDLPMANDDDVDSMRKAQKVKKKASFRHHKSTQKDDSPESPILVDTTLMAYDDDVDSITKGLEAKPVGNNSPKFRKSAAKNKTDHASVLRTNKAPMQYFATPMPMKSGEFNKFLKDHEMDVDFVTSPIRELPTIAENWPTTKKTNWLHQGSYYNSFATSSNGSNAQALTTPPALLEGKLNLNPAVTTTKKPDSFTEQFHSKIESITKALGGSIKFTKDKSKSKLKLKSKPKPKPAANDNVSEEKQSYWDQFERYKRSSESNLKSTRPVSYQTAQANYYSIFKRKMKEKLFEKKSTTANVLTTEPFSADPQNKEVEITIINFDDIDKMTTRLTYDTVALPNARREESSAFTDMSEMASTTDDATVKSTDFPLKEEMHNELLYKDAFKEVKTSTEPTTEYSSFDLSKNTEYVDPIGNDGRKVVTNNKQKYPFEKIPVHPNFLSEIPHIKNFKNNVPKRVHISSHHYKYDIFYDDIKNARKNKGVEGFRRKYGTAGIKEKRPMKSINRHASTSEKGTHTENVKQIDRTSHKNRHGRRVWRSALPHKHFTYRGCKPKADGGLIEPTGYFETSTPSSELENIAMVSGVQVEGPISSGLPDIAEVSVKFQEEAPFPSSVVNTAKISWSQSKLPMLDIEDLVTLLDNQNVGVTTSDIEDVVTLSAIRSQFFTSITIRDTVSPEPSYKTKATHPSTTKTPPKASIKTSSKASTKTSTSPSTSVTKPRFAVGTTPLIGSLVFNLNQLKPITPKGSKSKKESSGPGKGRQRRLFKISAMFQNRFKSLMKNFTTSTKPGNATVASNPKTPKNGTRNKIKRTCISFPDKPSVVTHKGDIITHNIIEDEGFRISFGPVSSEHSQYHFVIAPTPTPTVQHLLLPPCEDDSEEVPTYQRLFSTKQGNSGDCGNQSDVIYVEPEIYNDQQYQEVILGQPPPIPTPKIPPCIKEEPIVHRDIKREAQHNTFTAKDVAALEVIVDLMKNTLNYEDGADRMISAFQNSNLLIQPGYVTKNTHPNGSTNSIQVHIAIPYDFQNGKKRSPSIPGPVRVRKVFSAKMSSPVDLEYQVHSIEGTMPPTPTHVSNTFNFPVDGLTPGMYLLIDQPKDGYALKPVLGQINLSDLKSRQVESTTPFNIWENQTESREETTSIKSLAKVKLSKDFISAVNQQLVEMYENISRVNKDVNNNNGRAARSVWRSRQLKETKEQTGRSSGKYIFKRRINWEAVKKYFGHDRVCNCKCKANKTMCRACAASDAVVDELIFEFDNIGQYMSDHCTEIQTFFWMNPAGGQKLRESVHKIDRSLSDYYKRVKGKCRGKVCKAFTTYIDKRHITKTAKIKKKDPMSRLIKDLADLAEDLNRTVSLNVCYSDKLKENGDRFLNIINRCILKKKSCRKRSNLNTTQKKMIKNVYSLDNINVNIICNPEPSATTDDERMLATITSQDNSDQLNDHLLNLDLDEDKAKKHKGLKKLFPRKSKKLKLLSFFDYSKKQKANYKRQVDNQVATPLISDGGGAFWYDYLKAGRNEPRLSRDLISESPDIQISVVQKEATIDNSVQLTEKPSSNDLNTNLMYTSVESTPEINNVYLETTTESLSQNINQLLQLFGSLQDLEAINDNSNQSAMLLNNITASVTSASTDTTVAETYKIKTDVGLLKHNATNSNKGLSKDKSKMIAKESSKNKATKSSLSHKTTSSNLDKKLKELTTIQHTIESISESTTLKHANISTGVTLSKTNSTTVMANVSSSTLSTEMISEKATSSAATTTRKPDYKKSTTSSLKATSSFKTTIASVKNYKTKPTLISKRTTTKLGFLNKIKSATLGLLGSQKTSQTPKQTTETPITTVQSTKEEINLYKSAFIDIITEKSTLAEDYVVEESGPRTTANPTILIFNEVGSRPNIDTILDGNREDLRNLLLSIIQFETNNLNDEWGRVAYGKEKNRDEIDMKRSAKNPPKAVTDKPPIKINSRTKYSAEDSYTESVLSNTAKEPEGLLNKIVSRISMKVAGNKRKVVKNSTIRQVKDRNKVNFIKNRKLRINSYKRGASPRSSAEACHTSRKTKPSQICDIQATYDRIKELQATLPPKKFESVVKNFCCYKYKNVDALFTIPCNRSRRRWDWIRNKRSLKIHFYSRIAAEPDFADDDADKTVVTLDDDSNSFERFVRGDDGIYKMVNRRKRTTNFESLERGLRNIPNLTTGKDELNVMAGESVTLDCGFDTPVKTCDGQFRWTTDRKRMLQQDNVDVDGISITIHNVAPRNVGNYICSLDHSVRRNIKLSVLTVPTFDVVFLPVYKTEGNCSFDELKAIQRLGNLMSKENHCGKTCNIRIDEPVCLRDKGTNSTLIRVTAVISMTPREINCSLQCKRDIVSSLVMLSAANTAILSSIQVLMSKDGVNETLMPWQNLVRPVVTNTLRKKDSNGHHEYHNLVPFLSPGKVDVVLICPAGYYLLSKYKLCSSCPPNTSSKAGDNTCRSCPRGTRAEPGAAKCHVVKTLHRRYDWWWYPPCGYLVACCSVLFGCTTCVLLSLIVHVVSRDGDLLERENGEDGEQKTPAKPVTVTYAHVSAARPLSPSRVILPRFFRPSLTSSRATDSQETKFELWKERNRPPPLPPIDFDP